MSASAGTNLNNELDRLSGSLRRLADDHGMKPERKFVGAVKVGDYLLYEADEYDHDKKKSVKNSYCRRVCATYGEQGSGPTRGFHMLAMEGDKYIRKYGDRDYVIAICKEED